MESDLIFDAYACREAIHTLRDYSRQGGLDFRERDPLVLKLHDAVDRLEELSRRTGAVPADVLHAVNQIAREIAAAESLGAKTVDIRLPNAGPMVADLRTVVDWFKGRKSVAPSAEVVATRFMTVDEHNERMAALDKRWQMAVGQSLETAERLAESPNDPGAGSHA